MGVFTCHDCVDEVYTDSAVWHRVDHETIFFNSNDISKTNASSFLTQVRYSLCMKTFASATWHTCKSNVGQRLNDTAPCVHTSELRDVRCHMESHSVTCHLTQVNAPRLTPARKAGTRFAFLRGMEGWVDLGGWLHTDYRDGLPTRTHPSSNLAWHTATVLIETIALPLSQAITGTCWGHMSWIWWSEVLCCFPRCSMCNIAVIPTVALGDFRNVISVSR